MLGLILIKKFFRYAIWNAGYTLYVVGGIWIISAALAIPILINYDEVNFYKVDISKKCIFQKINFFHKILVFFCEKKTVFLWKKNMFFYEKTPCSSAIFWFANSEEKFFNISFKL